MIYKIKAFMLIIACVFLLCKDITIISAEEMIKTDTKIEKVIDNANILDETLLENKLNNFYNDYKVDIFIRTVEKSTQEEFENILKEYDENIYNNYLLFYISKESGDVGIYVNNSFKETVNDAVKVMMLSTMEESFKNNEFETGLIISLDNLSKVLDVKIEEDTHKVIEVIPINKNKEYLLIAVMTICFILFFSGFLFYRKK